MTIGQALKSSKAVFMHLALADHPMAMVSFRVPKTSVRDAITDVRYLNDEHIATWTFDEETQVLDIFWTT